MKEPNSSHFVILRTELFFLEHSYISFQRYAFISGGRNKNQKKRQDEGGLEARNNIKVLQLASFYSSSALSNPDRDIFKPFSAVTTAVGRISMT